MAMTKLREATPEELASMLEGVPAGTGSKVGRESVIATMMRVRRGELFMSSEEKSVRLATVAK